MLRIPKRNLLTFPFPRISLRLSGFVENNHAGADSRIHQKHDIGLGDELELGASVDERRFASLWMGHYEGWTANVVPHLTGHKGENNALKMRKKSIFRITIFQ